MSCNLPAASVLGHGPSECLQVQPLKVVRLGGPTGATAEGSPEPRKTRGHAHHAAATGAGAGVGGDAHVGRRGRCAVGGWWRPRRGRL